MKWTSERGMTREEEGSTSQREACLLPALLLDGTTALDTRLLLLELRALTIKLFAHFAVARVEFLFGLLELVLFLLHLLLEDHLHLELHLGEFLLVQGALFLLLDGRVDLLEHARVLRHAHCGELVGPVVLVEEVVGVLLEFLHVCADQHLAQLDEVAVLFVVDFDHAPWVATSADSATLRGLDLGVGADDSERHFRHYLVVLGDCLLVIELVSRALEDVDVVMVDIGEDLEHDCQLYCNCLGVLPVRPTRCLNAGNLVIGEGVCLCNDRDQVDLGVETAHNLNVQRLERVACGLDEVHASVDSIVDDVHAVDLVLGVEVGVESLLDVLHDRAPRVVVVNEVSEAWCVYDCEAQAHSVLLDVGADRLYAYCLGREVERRLLALSGWVEGGVKESVHECRFAQTRFAFDLVSTCALLSSRWPTYQQP